MPSLILRNREVQSVFELLGTRENDITYTLGWVLSRCGNFRVVVLEDLFPRVLHSGETSIRLQSFAEDRGFTDLEIKGPGLHVIVEAKRGWTLPSVEQLARYAERIQPGTEHRALLVLAECSDEYASRHLVPRLGSIPVVYRSWRVIADLARRVLATSGSFKEKGLLREFGTYMTTAIRTQNQTSNYVYVLSLAQGFPVSSSISWIDIVEVAGRYFHPYGAGGWPVEPPNYLAFRYGGQLRSIHHVEEAGVVPDVHDHIPQIAPNTIVDYMLYQLGPPVRPARPVKNGKIWPNGRYWAAIDLLLTCSTISEARDMTQQRMKGLV